ncbi:facilitated trehalose transporter Tret1-2 homolog isoform X2 [Bacillus rossius redtenbacheri]
MLSFCHGTVYGWLAPVQPLLQSADSPLGGGPMTEDAAATAGSLVSAAAVVAVPLFTHLGTSGSRRLAGCLAALPLLPGWLLVAFARSQPALFAGRLLAGLACGAASSMMLFVNEVAQDQVRGELCTFGNLLFNAGVLFAYVVGSCVPYAAFGLACLGAALVYLAGLCVLPESPYHLVKLGRTAEARRALRWYRGGSRDVEEELARMRRRVSEAEPVRWSTVVKAFSEPGAVRALLIGAALCVNAHFCGLFAIISYSVRIFQESGASMSPYGATILVGALRFASVYVAGLVVDRAGRRVLLVASNATMAASLVVLGGYLYAREASPQLGHGWLPVACTCVYIVSMSLGVGSLTFVIITELFSFRIRTVATTVCHCMLSFNVFVVVKTFPALKGALALHGCFWLYAGVCAAGVLLAYFWVPETSNRSLEAIQAQLRGDRNTAK